MIFGIYCTLIDMFINDTVFRADCKWTEVHSCWNKMKSGFGRVWVTYLEIISGSSWVGPNGPPAWPGKILYFRFVQTSVALSSLLTRSYLWQLMHSL
jgi:hypothetical protein